jgi:hypothetical protein
VNAATAALADDGIAMRGLDILHPVGIGTKHRDQVMFAINRGDYDWIGASGPDVRPRTSRAAWNLGGSPRPDHQQFRRLIQWPRRVGRQPR